MQSETRKRDYRRQQKTNTSHCVCVSDWQAVKRATFQTNYSKQTVRVNHIKHGSGSVIDFAFVDQTPRRNRPPFTFLYKQNRSDTLGTCMRTEGFFVIFLIKRLALQLCGFTARRVLPSSKLLILFQLLIVLALAVWAYFLPWIGLCCVYNK